MNKIKLTWYGRCCFLITFADNFKILTDPHDTFDNVDIGKIESDFTLISSIAHDHGHIGASPKSITTISPETYNLENGIKITGIQSKESRGTSNIIFNIQFGDLSLTNFADLGDPHSLDTITDNDREILNSTNIAFVRPNLIFDEENVRAGELALRYCNAKIIIPHHYYPQSFINKNPGLEKAKIYLPQIEELIQKVNYKKQIINSYEISISLDDFTDKTALLFKEIHPQITYNK